MNTLVSYVFSILLYSVHTFSSPEVLQVVSITRTQLSPNSLENVSLELIISFSVCQLTNYFNHIAAFAIFTMDDDFDTVTTSQFKDGVIDFIAGSVGGTAVVYVGQPLDTVKVKMQTFPQLYKGMLDCFVKTYRNEGVIRGLYAGTVPAITANVAENSILFLFYGFCQKLIAAVTNTGEIEQLSTLSNATAGCFASFFSAFGLCPTELIKVKLQCAREVALVSGSKLRVTGFDLLKDIVRKEGVVGLFQGLQSTIVREMPGYFVFFGAYEGTRSLLTPPGKTKNECGLMATIAAGAAAGVALWSVIYPIDVVKSRVQASNERSNVTLWKSIVDISRREGVLFLYSGLRPTLIRTVPATGVLFLSYEWTKKVLYGAWG